MQNPDHIIIRPARAAEIIGLSRVTLWRLERDGQFPKSIKMSSNSKGWWLDEVLAWLESRRTFSANAEGGR